MPFVNPSSEKLNRLEVTGAPVREDRRGELGTLWSTMPTVKVSWCGSIPVAAPAMLKLSFADGSP
jgi:hypothetical protein